MPVKKVPSEQVAAEPVITKDLPPFEKEVVIAFTNGVPLFHFHGDWVGKDITIVRNLLEREYHKYKKGVRRTTTKEE